MLGEPKFLASCMCVYFWLHVCMCVCVYVCMCVYVCVYVCMCVCMCVCVYVLFYVMIHHRSHLSLKDIFQSYIPIIISTSPFLGPFATSRFCLRQAYYTRI